jgi:hypothetical protein
MDDPVSVAVRAHRPENRARRIPAMMPTCQRCGTPYMQSRSTSALVLTYCGVLCETADLGFSLVALERLEVSHRRDALSRSDVVATIRDSTRELAV